MKLLLTFVCLAAHVTIAQTKLEWSEKKRLTTSDFKGPAPDPAKNQNLIVRTGFENKVSVSDLAGREHFNDAISNVFFPDDSWINWSDPSRLRYFLTCFDIDEWKARELRKRYYHNKKELTKESIAKIYSEVQLEFNLIHEQYNTDTNYGEHAQGQMNWEMRVSDKILALSDFCKSCQPKVRN